MQQEAAKESTSSQMPAVMATTAYQRRSAQVAGKKKFSDFSASAEDHLRGIFLIFFQITMQTGNRVRAIKIAITTSTSQRTQECSKNHEASSPLGLIVNSGRNPTARQATTVAAQSQMQSVR
jgi:hypothetical protein